MRDNAISWKPDGSINLGGSKAGRRYEISDEGLHFLHSDDVKAKVNKVFNAPERSLGERFHQGCGWMTRARRSIDRSDRLLYFFTAIESLLSDSDKTAPVIQTIARHAAVLLSDDNANRVEIAREIRRLYSLRSALVHMGERAVFDNDATQAHDLAESLFDRAWQALPLEMRHADFVSLLSRASYGLRLEEAQTEPATFS